MAGWQLEVFRMSLYMVFPVAIFYYFNQPQYFEPWVTKTKREMYPREDNPGKRSLETFLSDYKKKQSAELKAALEKES